VSTPAAAQPDFIPNPTLYDKMSAPYPSRDEANAAMQKFFEAVRKLRVKHRMCDVAVIATTHAMTGTSEDAMITGDFVGSQKRALDMHAWALGMAERDAARRVDEMRQRARNGATQEAK
jgi:hypothetical protein